MNITSSDNIFQITFNRHILPSNWIVSYPRSGNTFVRILIANYVSGLDRPLQLEEIVDSTCGEHLESIWLELTGKMPVDRSLEEEWVLRQAYFERLRSMTNHSIPLIKSHTLFGELDGKPAFKFVPRDRIIHIVRHPCDVAISCTHFYGIDLEEAISRLLRTDLWVNGAPEVGYEVIGSWAQHTRSWMQEVGAPIHRVRYFELIENSVDILMDIVQFLDFTPNKSRAEIAVEFSSFERLRLEEQDKGFFEASKHSNQPFFREGRPGQWLDVLTIDQALRILNDDPEVIEHFGFSKLILK